MTRQEAEIILQSKFKLHRFYDEQWDAIEKILKGERVLLIEKTGFGKSLCFQFPAILFNGTTVIFSPLISKIISPCLIPALSAGEFGSTAQPGVPMVTKAP